MPTPLPRVNVTVTQEQHALLLELASLDPDTPSASGFLRQLLDRVTPLLRTTVPMMRAARQAHGEARQQLKGDVAEFLGTLQQLDLLEDAPAAPGAPARSASEDGRTRAPGRRSA
jgi:hypothetical protein